MWSSELWKYSLYALHVVRFLAIYWFDYLKIDCETSKQEGNIQTEMRRKHSWSVLIYSWRRNLKCVIAFLRNFETYSVKLSLLWIMGPSRHFCMSYFLCYLFHYCNISNSIGSSLFRIIWQIFIFLIFIFPLNIKDW